MEIKNTDHNPEEEIPSPKIIGLTGGIGSGKTSVAKYLESKGFPVYYSDDRAKVIVNEDNALISNIKKLLGEEAYDVDGLYDRKYVADKVFSNQELLSQLNQLIHPAVKIDFENWIRQQESEFVFKETALLFELGLYKTCYKSLLVTAEDNLRIKRVMDRDGKTYRQVESVIHKQMPEKEKIKKADFVIYNNSNLEKLMLEADAFLLELK